MENRFGLRQVAGSGTSKESDEKQHSRWLCLSGGWSQPALLGWKEVTILHQGDQILVKPEMASARTYDGGAPSRSGSVTFLTVSVGMSQTIDSSCSRRT